MNLKIRAKIIERYGSQANFSTVVKRDEAFISRVLHRRRYLTMEEAERWGELLGINTPMEFIKGAS